MLPEFNVNTESINVVQQPSKTYRDKDDSISGYVDNLEAVRQTVYHILRKERYAYPIYPDNFGMEFEKYVGKSYEYFQATIENDLKAALTQDDRIYNVKVKQTVKLDIDKAYCLFTVYSTEGDLENMEADFGL